MVRPTKTAITKTNSESATTTDVSEASKSRLSTAEARRDYQRRYYQMHKENPDDPLDVQYGPSHNVDFTEGGILQRITGMSSAMVNSVHSQGVDRLGPELEVEAVADDGLIEAFTVNDAPGFTLGVQWHPEWKPLEDFVSTAMFREFGDACRAYRLRELRQ